MSAKIIWYNPAMRKGFSYLELLISLSILVVVASIFSAIFFSAVQKSFQRLQHLHNQKQITQVLDVMSEDVAYAEDASILADRLVYRQDGVEYAYLLMNNRLARKKTDYTYLTPKELVIQEFKPEQTRKNLFKVSIKTVDNTYIRVIRCRNIKPS
jgi:prepilin-type N-terminal cleavage/methylation domain-containing protein